MRGDLKPSRAWRETVMEDKAAYSRDCGPITVSVSDLQVDRPDLVRVTVWVYPRTIMTASVDAADFVLVERDGTENENAAGADRKEITRSRPEPFEAVFEILDLPRLEREGCRLRIPVTPLDPVEGVPIVVEVRFYPY
jgi:hypothetical protein